MPPRVIQPPISELDRLATPLNDGESLDGESLVVNFFHDHLPDGWEIYVQPFLNGNRPDLVVFNPECGRRRAASRLIAVTCVLSLALWLTQALAAGEQASPNLRVLHPGDNLIGWVGYAVSSQELFDQIPQAELIYTWDAESSRYRFAARDFQSSLQTIRPGMGLIVRIAGDDLVEWSQPTVADGEWVALRAGANLVAWTGPSGTPVDLAVRSIGDSFTHALYSSAQSSELAVYQTGSPLEAGDQHQLQRGDGLWVFNSSASNWLQPSGERALYPLGPPPDHVRWYASFDKYLDAGGIAVIATENVTDEALFRAAAIFDEMLVNRPDIRETLIRHRVHIVVVGRTEDTFDLTPYRQYRDRIELEAFGPEGPRGLGPNRLTPTLIPEENLLCDQDDPYLGHDVAVHEFAHAIDFAIRSGINSGGFSRSLASAYRSGAASGPWQGTHAGRNTAEYWATGVQSWFGLVGWIYPYKSNRLDLAHYAPDLAHLVAETLGEFELHTTCQRADSRSQGATQRRLFSGSTVDANGNTVPDYQVNLAVAATGEVAAQAGSRPDGTFHVYAPPGEYALEISLEGCQTDPPDSETPSDGESTNVVVVENQDLQLNIRLPRTRC
jgi:hypothetical protein